MIKFKSESANKTQQNNAKILFGSKGLSILAKLEEYSKEKIISTAGIDAVLEVLKTKDTALLEKFAASKTGKTLVTNCKQLAKAKTLVAIMKNIKAIKVLKSFDKFITPSAKPGAPPSSPKGKRAKASWVDMSPKGKKATHYIERDLVLDLDSRNRFNVNDVETAHVVDMLKDANVSGVEIIERVGPGGGNPFVRIVGSRTALDDLINEFESEGDPDARKLMPIKPLKNTKGMGFDAASFEEALDRAGDSTSAAYARVTSEITKTVRKLGNIPRSWTVTVEPYAVEVEGYFLEIDPQNPMDADIPDKHIICLGGLTPQNPNVKKWKPSNGKVTVIEQLDFDDEGETKRMDFVKAIKYVLAKNKSL